jgi:large subunit ribosomal protein L22
MLKATAKSKYLRMSAQKARRLARLLPGKQVTTAQDILKFMPQKPAVYINKVLKAAKANALNNYNMSEEKLTVDNVLIDEGPCMKRFKARARGRVNQIKKRTSHITITLKEQGA